jgi:hypothetical protein
VAGSTGWLAQLGGDYVSKRITTKIDSGTTLW